MAPLKGFTLGERQKHYNQIVKEAITNKTENLPNISFEDDDVANMIKIDIACFERNVDYILEVFKCEDMLYVTRAINKSTWLITDAQYAHIINPKYLHSELFPQMNAKAVTKLMLHIRRHLKDEVRCKAFYKYVNEKSPNTALRWLDNCPSTFVEKTVAARAQYIPVKVLTRLCRKSINILRVWAQSCNVYNYTARDVYQNTKFFLKRKETAEIYLSIVTNAAYTTINLNNKYTNILMKQCPNIIFKDFGKYLSNIELSTFVQYLTMTDIKSFFINNFAYMDRFEIIAPFLEKIPKDEIFDFLKELYKVDFDSVSNSDTSQFEKLFYTIECTKQQFNVCSSIYRWYRFAPFHIAFRDIKRFIFSESSPEERHTMLNILLTCAGNNMVNVKKVLQYYHDNHINEPYLHKITFINSLLAQHDTFRFDDMTWNILNRLFHSLEVYIESSNKVQACLIAIILRNVLCDLPVHEVVEKKFNVVTLVDIRNKLNDQEQDKIFNFLYSSSLKKLSKLRRDSETGLHNAIKLLKNIWCLLEDWNKVETHRTFVMDKISELGDTKRSYAWISEIQTSRRKRRTKRPNRDYNVRLTIKNPEPYVNIPSIYKMLKSHRKELMEMSVILNPSEEVCLNALKHDPGLLTRYKNEIDDLRFNEELSLNRFLCKLRVYWPHTLALEWTNTNITYIHKCKGHRALIRGILTLLPRKELLNYVKINAPDDTKIHWSEVNETELSVQKHIAKHMHIARPQLPAEVVLWYAKGDYLQYALLSLNTMYYNLRSNDIKEYINIMLNAPVSLQKHGIRLAFTRYKTDEIINIVPKVWANTKNTSIRAELFTATFKCLCKEKKTMSIKALWTILSSFIDDLNDKENKAIYTVFKKICDVPLAVIGECYKKMFLFLKNLPPQTNSVRIFEHVTHYGSQFVEYLDSDFVENFLLDSVYDNIANWDHIHLEILAVYLLNSKDVTIQMQKYNNVLKPVIDQCAPMWADGKKDLLDGLQELLSLICSYIPQYVIGKKMVMPCDLLVKIADVYNQSLSVKEHYGQIRRWLLTIKYLEHLRDEIKAFDESFDSYTWESLRTKTTRALGKLSASMLAADLNHSYSFTTIYLVFKDAFKSVLRDFKIENHDLLRVLYKMLEWKLHPGVYLLVLKIMPAHRRRWDDYYTRKMEAIKRKLYCYDSDEVSIQYFQKFSDKYNENDEGIYDNESEDDDYESDDDSCSDDSYLSSDSRETEDFDTGPQHCRDHNVPSSKVTTENRYSKIYCSIV